MTERERARNRESRAAGARTRDLADTRTELRHRARHRLQGLAEEIEFARLHKREHAIRASA